MKIGRPPFRVDPPLDPAAPAFRLTRSELPPGIPTALVREVEQYIEGVYAGREINRNAAEMPCFWLDLETRLCRNYTFRPKVCREVDCSEEGSSDCRYHQLGGGQKNDEIGLD